MDPMVLIRTRRRNESIGRIPPAENTTLLRRDGLLTPNDLSQAAQRIVYCFGIRKNLRHIWV
jgi:hypothetical protein